MTKFAIGLKASRYSKGQLMILVLARFQALILVRGFAKASTL